MPSWFTTAVALAIGLTRTGPVAAQPGPTPDEAALLADGEIESGTHTFGVITATLVGFGAGQGIQGRWRSTGWIFTIGEAAAVGAIGLGTFMCFDDHPGADPFYCSNQEQDGKRWIIGGVIGLIAFRAAGIADAIIGPVVRNRRVRDLRRRYGVAPLVAPSPGGMTAGIAVRW